MACTKMSPLRLLRPFFLLLMLPSCPDSNTPRTLALVSANNACPKECTCRWKGGKETVECINRGLALVPVGIDHGTQVLDLSDNNLQSLSKDLFLRSKLLNLQRIYLANCNVGQIHEGAFHRLSNLIELDLSGNHLVAVPVLAFRDVPGLRRLILSNNPIERIENNAFASLVSLTTLELSRCRLESLAPKAFHHLKGLKYLKLDNNRLTTISGKTIQPLKNLHGVDLHANKWKCDCSMQDVKLWLTQNNIPYQVSPTCAQPERLRGLALDTLQMEDLACRPQAADVNPRRRLTEVVAGHNASIACEVSANPEATIQWFRFGQPIINLTRLAKQRKPYIVQERGSSTTDKASILTVLSATDRDAGEYVCVAENRAGRYSVNFSLEVTFADLEASEWSGGQIAGIGLGLVLLGAIASLLVCILLAKWRQTHHNDVKHPPLDPSQHKLIHVTTNHLDYDKTNNTSTTTNGQSLGLRGPKSNSLIHMSFSLPRPSRSNSIGHKCYSNDEGSDGSKVLVENFVDHNSGLSSSGNPMTDDKPDVVRNAVPSSDDCRRNTSKTPSSSSSSKKSNSLKRHEKKDKKKHPHHRWKDEPPAPSCENDKKLALVQSSLPEGGQTLNCHGGTDTEESAVTSDTTTVGRTKDVSSSSFEDLDLKLSPLNEWCTLSSNGANFLAFDHKGSSGGENEEDVSSVDVLGDQSVTVPNHDPKAAAVVVANTHSLPRNAVNNANARFRHYVPVLPPLPVQHYTQVRNSLGRPNGKEADDDLTDM